MNNTSENLTAIFENRISDFLQKPFSISGYSDKSDDAGTYDVTGTITRYGKPVNIQVSIKKDGYIPSYWYITDDHITLQSRYLGEILLGKDVCVSDPCYDRDVWCMTVLHNVKPGRWGAHASIDMIDSWGERCYVLELFHRTVRYKKDFDWEERFDLGVDSGTMSVIDNAHYQQKPGSSEPDKTFAEQFTNKCFDLLSDKKANIYRYDNKKVGVVCSSGIGDGSYPLYTVEKDGEIIAIKISFM